VALVAPSLRNDQAQVSVDHSLLGRQVATLNPLGELDLLRRGEQRMRPSLTEEQVQRVGTNTLIGAGRPPGLGIANVRGMNRASPGLSLGRRRSCPPRAAVARTTFFSCIRVFAPNASAGATLGINTFQLNLR
jgi:hypothetical protein